MLFDVISFAVNVVLPVALFASWIVAELRCYGAHVRISLGLACLVFPVLWIGATIYSSNNINEMHRLGLKRIERLMQDGREDQVKRALQVYQETYQETQSAKAAVFRMDSVLTNGTGGAP